jgi:hypothetical protein
MEWKQFITEGVCQIVLYNMWLSRSLVELLWHIEGWWIDGHFAPYYCCAGRHYKCNDFTKYIYNMVSLILINSLYVCMLQTSLSADTPLYDPPSRRDPLRRTHYTWTWKGSFFPYPFSQFILSFAWEKYGGIWKRHFMVFLLNHSHWVKAWLIS